MPKPHVPDADQIDRLAEPFAFALVTWPVAALAVQFSAEDEFWWRVGALVWLALFQFAAYRRGRGAAFGNVMLFSSAVVALAWWAFPSPWSWLGFPLLLIGLHGAQRALLRRPPPHAAQHVAGSDDSGRGRSRA